jgi:hypothetical protein
MKDWVFFYLTLHSPPPKTHCEAHSGRFSGFRIILFLAPSHPESHETRDHKDSGSGKFRPRLQRRGRPRLSRGSLFGLKPPEHGSIFNYLISHFLRGCQLVKLGKM